VKLADLKSGEVVDMAGDAGVRGAERVRIGRVVSFGSIAEMLLEC
jgi:hypothetical protein